MEPIYKYSIMKNNVLVGEQIFFTALLTDALKLAIEHKANVYDYKFPIKKIWSWNEYL